MVMAKLVRRCLQHHHYVAVTAGMRVAVLGFTVER